MPARRSDDAVGFDTLVVRTALPAAWWPKDLPRKGVSGCWWRNSAATSGGNAFDRYDGVAILVYP